MWRDEIQAWLIARDCKTPFELIKVLKNYEGHPGLWHFGLFILKFITYSPVIMQPYHLIIATTTVYLFCRFSPFTRLQKVLFSFGYFSFYEYAVICRNYAVGILLLCSFCILFESWRRKFPLIGLILFLLAHTSVHALIIVISIFAIIGSPVYFRPTRKIENWNRLCPNIDRNCNGYHANYTGFGPRNESFSSMDAEI